MTGTGTGTAASAAAARAERRGGARRTRMGRWIALGGGVAAALVATGVAVAATNGGDSTAAGPSADKAFAACVAAGKAYCLAPGQVAAAAKAGQAQQAAPAAMTESEAVGAALKLAAPAAGGKTAALAPAHTDKQMSLADYEKAIYGGKHVNTSFSPEAQVWVIDVAAAPNPASVNAPPGVRPPKYTHYTVVIDVATHQWVDEDYSK